MNAAGRRGAGADGGAGGNGEPVELGAMPCEQEQEVPARPHSAAASPPSEAPSH